MRSAQRIHPAPEVSIQPGKVIAERLRQIREQTAPARLNYNRPSELAVGEQTVVVVGLTPLLETALQAADERLAAELGVASEVLTKVTIKRNRLSQGLRYGAR